MLERLTNADLIEHIQENPDSTEAELEVAERLLAAMDELDRLTTALRRHEAKEELRRLEAEDGANA